MKQRQRYTGTDWMRCFFRSVAPHQSKLRSFRKFVEDGLTAVIGEKLVVPYENKWHVWTLVQYVLDTPELTECDGYKRPLTPTDCRRGSMTYNSLMSVRVLYRVFVSRDGRVQGNERLDEIERRGVLIRSELSGLKPLVRIPMMLRATGCTLRTQYDWNKSYKHGGDFVTNGRRITINAKERARYNYGSCTKDKKKCAYRCEIRSAHLGKYRSSSNVSIEASIHPYSRKLSLSVILQFARSDDGKPKQDRIPILVVLRMLGVVHPDDALLLFQLAAGRREFWTPLHESAFQQAVVDASSSPTQEEALARVGLTVNAHSRQPVDSGFRNICREFLPHIDYCESTGRRKAFWVAIEACRLVLMIYEDFECKARPSAFTYDVFDNKDLYCHKRLQQEAELITDLLRKQVNSLFTQPKAVKPRLKQGKDVVLEKILCEEKNTKKITTAFATSNSWVTNNTTQKNSAGPAQTLDHVNALATISNLARTSNPLTKDGKILTPRFVCQSQLGKDPFATPEGAACGLNGDLAVWTTVSIGTDGWCVLEILKHEGWAVPFDYVTLRQMRQLLAEQQYSIIVLNGDPCLLTRLPATEILAYVRELRRDGRISKETGVSYRIVSPWVAAQCAGVSRGTQVSQHDERLIQLVDIRTDSGRVLRPLLVVERMRLLLGLKCPLEQVNWSRLVQRGVIDWVDREEERHALVLAPEALRGWLRTPPEERTATYDYAELHGIGMLSLTVHIPFLNHNPSPKVTSQEHMNKASLNQVEFRPAPRSQLSSMGLLYAERPLVHTAALRVLHGYKQGSGVNLIVLIDPGHDGGSIEDSIMKLESAFQLSCGHSLSTSTTFAKEYKLNDGISSNHPAQNYDTIGLFALDRCVELRVGNRKCLGADGIVEPGSAVDPECVVVSRSHELRAVEKAMHSAGAGGSAPLCFDTSVNLEMTEFGVVPQRGVQLFPQADRKKGVRVAVQTHDVPQEGDKLDSRHGQKGVIGNSYTRADAPFCPALQGMVPDIMINTQGFYGRMTVGQVLENLLGLFAAAKGTPVDGTAWDEQSIPCIRDYLLRHFPDKEDDMGFDEHLVKDKLVEALGEALHEIGLPRTATHWWYDGRTGERIERQCHMGISYYSVLKQKSYNKVRSRGQFGPRAPNRQPRQGRRLCGGLRLGDMERDTMIAAGASNVLQEVSFHSSDRHKVSLCPSCHRPSTPNFKTKTWRCPICGRTDIVEMALPFNFTVIQFEAATGGFDIVTHPVLGQSVKSGTGERDGFLAGAHAALRSTALAS